MIPIFPAVAEWLGRDRQARRPATDMQEFGTVDDEKGEGVPSAETLCAIWLGARRHQDRATARSRRRSSLYPVPLDQSLRGARAQAVRPLKRAVLAMVGSTMR